MPKRDAESRRAALVSFMETRNLKPGPWAKDAGIAPTTLYGFVNAQSNDMGAGLYEALATAAGVSVDELLGHTDEARTRILTAAERLIDEIGFEHVSVPMICEKANVRPSVFLAHFDDMRSVLFQIVETYNERSFADLRRLAPAYGPLRDRLSYLFRRYFEQDMSHARLTATLQAYSWEWSKDLERRNQQQLSEHHKIVLELFESAAEKKEIKRGNFTAASQLLFAAYTLSLRKGVFDGFTAEQLEKSMLPAIDIVLKSFSYKPKP